jgi:hypothetical protein
MIALRIGNAFSSRALTGMLAALLLASCAAAQTTSKTPPKTPAKAPAAKPAAAPAKGATSGASTGSHGPTTAGRGATTTSGRGATTTTAGRGATTTSGRGTAANNGRGATGGRGVTASRGGPAAPGRTVRTANGSEVRMRSNGRPGDVHVANRGMDIHHGLNGDRRVAVERGDHSRIVSERGGRGYVQRPYMYRGREYGHRTYYYHGRAYDRFYSRYPYHGVYMDVYSPAAYYAPGFYGWAYNPWAAPIHYGWGWGGNPWYGYYGYYFTPYPVYPSASLWLTDYLISTTLAAAYQAQVDAAAVQAGNNGAPPPDAVALTPQVKDMIAAEVQRQIALENSEAQAAAQNAQPDPASSGIQRMMTDGVQHVFVAGSDIDVVDASGAECAVSEGDALQLTGPPAGGATNATLLMLSSKGGQECRRGATVSVAVADLQDMQNHMRETIDQGMGDLKAKQSQGGLPAIPAAANAAPTKAAFAADAPPPDPNAGTEITQQAQDADKAEQEVLSQTSQSSGGPSVAGDSAAPAPVPAPSAPPATVSLGQTIDQITAMLGAPKSIVNLGAKKIYVYPDMKITFTAGKVTDVK